LTCHSYVFCKRAPCHTICCTVPPLYHHRTNTAPPLHHHCTTTVPPLYHHGTKTIPPLYQDYTTTTPPLYHHCTTLHHHCTKTIPPLHHINKHSWIPTERTLLPCPYRQEQSTSQESSSYMSQPNSYQKQKLPLWCVGVWLGLTTLEHYKDMPTAN